nr:polysaccharide deacetylase family protein [Propionibacterium sp.]
MNDDRPTPPPTRRLLRLAAVAACSTVLVACSPAAPAGPASAPGATPPGPVSPASASLAFAACSTPPDRFVNQAPGDGRTVALTFDDGPAPADAEILNVLADQGVKATFFVTGEHAAADPDTVRRMAAEGHLVAGHSWEHRYPKEVAGGWTVSYLTDQLERTDALLTELTGRRACFFRPPGGNKDNVLAAAGAAGLTSVLWNVDSLDWKQPSRTTTAATAEIVAAATGTTSDHPVVLLHSGKASHEPDTKYSPHRGNTVAALPEIIGWYRAHGYSFVRLDGVS